MTINKPQERDMELSNKDKDVGMSDTAFAQGLMREAFPVPQRYPSVKAALYEAYRFIKPRVKKDFTPRRARSIWEGKAKRIDAEETDALRKAIIKGARDEQQALRDRLQRLDTALALIDEDFFGPQMAAHRSAARGLGGMDMPGANRD